MNMDAMKLYVSFCPTLAEAMIFQLLQGSRSGHPAHCHFSNVAYFLGA